MTEDALPLFRSKHELHAALGHFCDHGYDDTGQPRPCRCFHYSPDGTILPVVGDAHPVGRWCDQADVPPNQEAAWARP